MQIYDVYPKIVPAGKKSTITINPLSEENRFSNNTKYEIHHSQMEYFQKTNQHAKLDSGSYEIKDGALYMTVEFRHEQEHILIVDDIGEFHIYSLEKDLLAKKPFKGDMHIHSTRSDGEKDLELIPPAYRKKGFDYIALTDHGQYEPSIEVQNAFKDVNIDLLICRGEEIHPPQENPVHLVNFGGEQSINSLFEDNGKFNKEVKEIEKNINDIPDGINAFHYASLVWCFNKIREYNGLGILCHPYWVFNHQYNVSADLISYIFKKHPFDAYELLGGYSIYEADSNVLQVSRYSEERVRYNEIPIVGSSDTHWRGDDELFGWFWTIVFSEKLTVPSLIRNIKNLHSVAVESLPGEKIRVYGPFRLVKYALFLLREIFPLHDEICFKEGELMMQYIQGDKETKSKLEKLQGRTSDLFKKYWST